MCFKERYVGVFKMTLSDREKFILHLVALMTMQHFGMFKDKEGLHELVRKNRCRRLTEKDVSEIFDDIQEEMLLGKTVYEEMDLGRMYDKSDGR